MKNKSLFHSAFILLITFVCNLQTLDAQDLDLFKMRVTAFGGFLGESENEIELRFGRQSKLDRVTGLNSDLGITHVEFLACLHPDNLLRDVLSTNKRIVFVDVTQSDVKHGFSGIDSFPNLARLHLSNTDVEDFSFLAKMPKLAELRLSYSCFQDTDVKYIKELASLKFLDITYSNITKAGLEELGKLPNLETLEVAGPEVNDENYRVFLKYPALKTLEISRSRLIEGWWPSHLSEKAIEELRAHGIEVRGIAVEPNIRVTMQTDSGAKKTMVTWQQLLNIENPETVTQLYLLDTAVNDDSVSELERFTNLQLLSLFGAPITDRSLQVISKLPKLRTLELENTRISDRGFQEYWRTVSMIEHLQLSATGVVGTGISRSNFPNLKTLDLFRSNTEWKTVRQLPELTDSGILAIAKLDSLEELHVSWDKCVDVDLFCSQIGSLPNLKELYIDGIELSESEKNLLRSKNEKLDVVNFSD